MDITFQYSKKRCDFGRQPQFCEQGPDMCDSLATSHPEHKFYILRNPVHQLTQNTPCFSEHRINTIRAEYSNSGANHSEGGWPKDVNILDPEATQRYRRKIEKDDNYIHCVMSLMPGMEHYVLQNNAIDMYRTYYAEMMHSAAVERSGCRTVNVYRDETRRTVCSMSWLPEHGTHFAVAYADLDWARNVRGPLDGQLWDAECASTPMMSLTPPAPLLDLQYAPRDGTILAGALGSGQACAWDTRAGSLPIMISPPHVAHRDFARRLLFINSKTGLEFFTGGADGTCKWWDIRNMSEPTDEMIMDVVKSSFDNQSMVTANGVSVLEYEATIPTRFMAGTENGLIISGNRKGKTPMEKLPAKYDAHLGCVWSLERNPGFPKNFLSVGDWTARVWSEECRESAVLWTPGQRHRVTAGTWSPARLALMALSSGDGRLSLWDLLRRQHKPIVSVRLASEPLISLRFHEAGALLLIGSQKGRVFLCELSHNLAQNDKNDKSQLTAMFERESRRERILEARLREIRLKMRQAEEGSPVTSMTDVEATLGDRDLHEAAADYQIQVKKELAAM